MTVVLCNSRRQTFYVRSQTVNSTLGLVGQQTEWRLSSRYLHVKRENSFLRFLIDEMTSFICGHWNWNFVYFSQVKSYDYSFDLFSTIWKCKSHSWLGGHTKESRVGDHGSLMTVVLAGTALGGQLWMAVDRMLNGQLKEKSVMWENKRDKECQERNPPLCCHWLKLSWCSRKYCPPLPWLGSFSFWT